ncbi:MAG: PhoH family protein [Myxococcales bacterium]|nr:PhoH family protein [Myxococcales bacterium]MCB9552431.1 PhoH family protein [Myxococcales bacterium]
MRKTFVLDTNVLLHEPRAFRRFADNDVVLPIYVVEELDAFKKDISGLGRNARAVSRELDELRNHGRLNDGVPLDNGGTLRVVFARDVNRAMSPFGVQHQYDNLILRCCLELREANPDGKVVLVTKDTNLRLRADALGLDAVDYDPEHVDIADLYPGHREVDVDEATLRRAFDGGIAPPADGLIANEYLLLRNTDRPKHTALARVEPTADRVVALPPRREPIWGITARNKEQSFALDLLLDDRVPLVTLVGKAGTGKTLLALAAALAKVTDDERYQRVLVSRPIFPLGRDLGFLPGTVEEKLDPWMKPIYDNVELLLSQNADARRLGHGHQTLVDMGLLEIEPLTYIRGRSIPRQYMIIDEAQNLTPHEVKTILTRAGEGTKVVFTGDPYQIDNPYVDASDNGLVHLVRRMAGQPLAGTVTLSRGERSVLAELAANVL